MRHCAIVVSIVALAALIAPAVRAAPSLPVTKPPILFGVPSWTGPAADPHAEQGQWFQDVATGAEAPLTHEFYDNVTDPAAGGGPAGITAILGLVNHVATDPASGHITGFGILATITNDAPALSPWAMGMNTHTEMLMLTSLDEQYTGPLLDTKMTASFAMAPGLPPPEGQTYQDIQPYIVAANHDALAWFGWAPGSPEDYVPTGGFAVPTWDFGDILPGESATRQLEFTVDGGGLAEDDPRYDVLLGSGDVLLNRTLSLKISDWLSPVTADDGTPYFDPYVLSSDVSVFHNVPEPATLALVALGGLAVLLRRRRG